MPASPCFYTPPTHDEICCCEVEVGLFRCYYRQPKYGMLSEVNEILGSWIAKLLQHTDRLLICSLSKTNAQSTIRRMASSCSFLVLKKNLGVKPDISQAFRATQIICQGNLNTLKHKGEKLDSSFSLWEGCAPTLLKVVGWKTIK